LSDRRLIDPGGIMGRSDQGSPLPSDPAGREDIMSDEQAGRADIMSHRQAGREGVSPDEPEDGAARAGTESATEESPLPSDPARREDVVRDAEQAEQPGAPAAGG
jgi:hypothetical protein